MAGHKYTGLIIISIFLIFFGCNPHKVIDDQNSNQLVQYLLFNKESPDTIVIDTIIFNLVLKNKNSYTIFEYKNDFKQEIYQIDFSEPSGYLVNSDDTLLLKFIDKSEITLFPSKKRTSVYKFVTVNSGIDNSSYIYITPELGLILKKSTTWPIFFELSRHYLDKENTFNLILSLIYNEKDYYNGIYPDVPPPLPIMKDNGISQ